MAVLRVCPHLGLKNTVKITFFLEKWRDLHMGTESQRLALHIQHREAAETWAVLTLRIFRITVKIWRR